MLILMSAGISLGLISLLMVGHPLLSLSAFILFYGFSFYGHQPALTSLAGALVPEDKRGAIFGILFFLVFGVGSVSTAIVSFCANAYGLVSAFLVVIFISIIAIILSFLVPERASPHAERTITPTRV